MSQEMLTATVSPETEFIKSLRFRSLNNLGGVDIDGGILRLAAACAAGLEASLVGSPLVGEHISTVHATDGDNHGLGSGAVRGEEESRNQIYEGRGDGARVCLACGHSGGPYRNDKCSLREWS